MNINNETARSMSSSNLQDIQWETIFNAIGHPAIILGRDHRIVAANEASIRLTGIAQDEIIDKYCFEVFHHLNSEAAAGCPMERMLQSGVMETVDMEMEALGGTFLVSCTPILAADGSIDKVIHIATDITERKMAERDLVNSNVRFQAVLDNLDVIVYVADMDTYELLFLNKQGRDAFGDITGQICWKALQADQEGPCAFCTNSRLLLPGAVPAEPVLWEFQNTINKRWYECRDQAIRWADGRLVRLEMATDISARKEIDLKLAAETAFNKSIIENAPEGLCVCQAVPDFPYVQFTVWNESMASITGYTIDEINACGFYQTLYPDREAQARAVERMERMRRGDNLVGEEWTIYNKRGLQCDVAIWTTVLSVSGDAEHVLAFFIDITEQKRLRERHEQSRQDWEDTFQSINDAITILDNDYNIIRANRASENLLRTPLNYLISQKCFSSYHGLDEPLPHCPTCQTMETGEPSCCEYFEAHLGKYLEFKAFPRIGQDGESKGVIHVVRDITEKKQSELALNEQQDFTDALIENSTVAMFVLDNKHHVQVWNKACENLTGCTHDDMTGRDDHWKAFYESRQPTLADVVLDGDFDRLPKLYTHVSRSTHNPNGFKADGWFSKVNGKDRYLMIEAAPIYGRHGNMTHVLETISDLTESKSLEEQLLHAQKMESIGHLAGGIAHEFNNILAVILGYGQAMHMGLEPDSISMHDLDQILTAAERAAVLTKGLLAFSRKQHISLKNLDVSVLVHNTLKSFSRIMGDDIIINESLDSVPLIVYADQALVTQVLMNLIVNARDAMPSGGELVVCTKRTVLDESYSTPLCSIPSGKYALISISDSGHGIDDETVQSIFEPFFTTKDVGKGTGLGLSVVYGVISQHNGYVCVSSLPGHGTTFDLYFPLIEQQTPADTSVKFSASLLGGDETILVADDEPSLLTLFSEVLSELGYNVVTATDGVDAVDKYRANEDKIKLLILDVQMRRKSGLQAYEEIKLINPACRALFVSGFNVEQFHGDMALEEGTELLTKPFAAAELAGRVRKMLDASGS